MAETRRYSGMRQAAVPRWAMSLADLGLLLLGFFIILYTGRTDVKDVARAARGAFGEEETGDVLTLEVPAESLFERGEARLTAAGEVRFLEVGRRAAALGHKVRIESVGKAEEAARFDGWELAAARTAAVARAVEAGGVPSERIEITMPPDRRRPPPPPGQQLTVTSR